MCLVVTGVSTLIHLYSLAYMASDRGYARFFCYLNFFVFSMLLLVLAGNYILLIVGWAFVGFASYALISFWYRRETATTAGMKAFVINVVGDIGLVLAAFFIFRELGTFDYLTSFDAARDTFTTNQGVVIAICLLLCVGAFAKSAQVPFHTWLPDAMEGPTPVSSLIHAATMVTAGVYLIARMFPLFELAPTAADIAAFVGLATLLIAATIALAVTDLKRIIAYSTMSQIGYMIMGVSIGAYAGGLFMLMAHAFFKALLFMAAGSIISAMANNQNIDDMRGFRKAMPFTSALLLIGCLALAAFPGTSGLLLQGRDPRLRRRPRRHVLDLRHRRLRRRAADRLLRVPDRLPGGRRQAVRGGRGARGRPHAPRPADEPAHRRARGHRRRLPGRGAPHRRARVADEGRDGDPRASARCSPG